LSDSSPSASHHSASGEPKQPEAIRLDTIDRSIRIQESSIVELRRTYARGILILFGLLNAIVLGILIALVRRDGLVLMSSIRYIEDSKGTISHLRDVPQIVTGEVLVSLLAASAVQVGSAIYLMGKFLFNDGTSKS
jgi:hypothetical protein